MRAIAFLIRLPFVLFLNSLSLFRWTIAMGIHRFLRLFSGRELYVRLNLEGTLPLERDRKGLAKYFDHTPTFLQLRRDLKRVAQQDEVTGVILEPNGAQLGRATAGELSELIDDLRDSGKRVVSTIDLATTSEYLLASSADDVTMSPAGRLYTFAPRIEQIFFTPLLRKLGVAAQFVHIGAFKTGYNRFTLDEPSPGDAAMTTEVRDKLDGLTRETLAQRRGLTVEEASSVFRHAPMDARRARREGFIDAEVFGRDVNRFVTSGGEHRHKPAEQLESVRSVALNTYIDSLPKPLNWRPFVTPRRRIAVVDLTGMIVMPRTNIPGARQTIDPDEVLPALEKVRNGRYDGLLLHINSPGGSAIASDIIWHAIDDVRARIPVVAYCSDVVGSGGYYMAVGADQIVCRRESIVGSIGVITGKISAGEAVGRLGLEPTIYQAEDAPSPMLSLTQSFTRAELEVVKDEAREFYRRFLHRVGVARGLSKRRLHRYARGRVYLGDAAQKRGLVDSTGGFEDALARLEDLVEEKRGETTLHFVAVHRESLGEALRSQVRPSFGASAREVLGPRMMDQLVEPLVARTLFARESTLALMDTSVVTDREI